VTAPWRALAALVLAANGAALGLGGAGSLRAALTVEAMLTGRAAPIRYVCAFRQTTGVPCLGCGGTTAFGLVARGHVVAGLTENPLGGFAGLAAWTLALASILTLATGAPAGLARVGVAVLALLPLAFVVNALVWWWSLPPGALPPR
jgi:hypothetical protein